MSNNTQIDGLARARALNQAHQASKRRTFTRKQIAKMSAEEYRKNRTAIFAAARAGLIH